jgi:hypothetical protein
MHLADTVGDTRIKQDALGRRCLAGVNVRHDSNIPATIQRDSAGHGLVSHLQANACGYNFCSKS